MWHFYQEFFVFLSIFVNGGVHILYYLTISDGFKDGALFHGNNTSKFSYMYGSGNPCKSLKIAFKQFLWKFFNLLAICIHTQFIYFFHFGSSFH